MGRRIIFTVTNDLNFDQRMHRICGTLSDAGYRVTLIGRLNKNSLPPINQAYQQIQLMGMVFTKGKLFYLEFNLRLLLFLLFKPCDAICSIDLDTVIPGILVAKLRRKIHFFDAHELFTHVPEVARRKLIQDFWEVVQKIAFRHTHSPYTVGSAIAQYFEKKYNRQVAVVRNMPIASNMHHQPNPTTFSHLNGTRFILYQGALNEARGLEYLIQAMLTIPCDLVLAGEGDLSKSLRKQCAELQINHKVHFLGMIPPHQLPELTAMAFLGFNVSENAGLSYYLSLNNKFFDYTQAHLPSLINPFPEYKQLLAEYQVGLLTESEALSISTQANLMLQNDVLYQNIKAQCASAASIWTWEIEKIQLLHIYQKTFEQFEFKGK